MTLRSAQEELATSLTYTLSGDPIAGLAINADGSFSDPKNAAYEYLAVGEEEVITVNYRVTDPGLNGAVGLLRRSLHDHGEGHQ